MDQEYLNPKQVQAVYGVKTTTLAKWRSRKLGPDYIKIEGTVVYKTTDLQTFFEAHRVRCVVPQKARLR